MGKKFEVIIAVAVIWFSISSGPCLAAQETAKADETHAQPLESYKVDFTINEVTNGKKTNSRSYSMQLATSATNTWSEVKRLRMGTRVPIVIGPGNSFQYQDVGMDIDCRLMPMGNGKAAISTTWAFSTVQANKEHDTTPPVFRQARSEVAAVVTYDKPAAVSEVDDVDSATRYVFEVKVTRLNP